MRDNVAKNYLTRSGTRRHGDDYQDRVALDLMVDWLEHTDRYQWIRVEADESGTLDDVQALRKDNTFIVKQVKYSTDPDAPKDPYTWEILLKQEKGKKESLHPSLLQKWASSLEALNKQYSCVEAAVVSNRKAAQEIQHVMTTEGCISFDKIIDPTVRTRIIQQLGDETNVRNFFSQFQFHLNEPGLDELEYGLQKRFERLGGTDIGWSKLKEEVNAWVCHKDEPTPSGIIRLQDIRNAALWSTLHRLPQDFEIPTDYVLPSQPFHARFVADLLAFRRGCKVLAASPGMGKSTYVSYLYQQLQKQDTPVIRHHYFLSLSDRTASYRLEHLQAAESLMYDLAQRYSMALGSESTKNSNPHDLGRWIETCGKYYLQQDKALIVIIDGLDHVWREKGRVEELQELLKFLLPAPEGVVVLLVTQPLDESMLPPSLDRAAPRKQWENLPSLDRDALKHWLLHHSDELAQLNGLLLSGHTFERFTEVLYQKNLGHPLHLRYTFITLQEQYESITERTVQDLPSCPHADIAEYYRDLWRSLPELSRSIVYLMAACPFAWPKEGLFTCLDSQDVQRSNLIAALKQVRHLLVQGELGLQPFHSSLLAFVRDDPDYPMYESSMKRKAVMWLRTCAPMYWRWAHEWLIEAELGNEYPLRDGPTRRWVVEALAERRPRQDLENILTHSLAAALREGDFPRAIEIGILKDYSVNAFEFHEDVLEQLLYAQLEIEQDPNLRRLLLSDLDNLTDGEIVLLAESAIKHGSQESAKRYFRELKNRVATNRSRRQLEIKYSKRAEIEPFFKAALLADNTDDKHFLHICTEIRLEGLTRIVLQVCGTSLQIQRDAKRLRHLLKIPEYRNLYPEEQAILVRYAVLLALEERLDMDYELCRQEYAADPFVAIYAALHSCSSLRVNSIQFPNPEFLSWQRYEIYERQEDMQDFFYLSFFCFLANALWNKCEQNKLWLQQVITSGWHYLFLQQLNTVAQELATLLLAKKSFSFGLFYNLLRSLRRPSIGRFSTEFYYWQTATSAASDIGLDLYILSQFQQKSSPIIPNDIKALLASDYYDAKDWVFTYTARRRAWLSKEAVALLIEEQINQLTAAITPFADRARMYAGLASVASLHKMKDEAQRYVLESTNNLLTHAYHKDMLFYHALGAIQAYHTFCQSRESEDKPICECREWSLSLVPALTYIHEYTDSDHMQYAPERLAEILSKVSPHLLLPHYQWQCIHDKRGNPRNTLRLFLETADRFNPITRTMVKTVTDPYALSILEEWAAVGEGNDTAANLERINNELEEELDLEDADSQDIKQNNTDDTESIYNIINNEVEPWDLLHDTYANDLETISDPAGYPPSMLNQYLKQQKGGIRSKEAVARWIAFWTSVETGDKEDAFNALERAIEQGRQIRNYDAIFDLACSLYGQERSYQWLVRAQAEYYGWSEDYYPKDDALHRWERVQKWYPERWFDFLHETIQEQGKRTIGLTLGHHMFTRIVEYYLFTGHPEQAKPIVEKIVLCARELVSPQVFPTPPWIDQVEKAENQSKENLSSY